MKGDAFYNEFRKLLRESIVLKATVLLLLVVLVGQFLAIVFLLKNQRVILVPTAKFTKEVVLTSSGASPEYTRIFVRDALNLLTNYTPQDVEQRFKELLFYISPKYYKDAEIFLASKAKRIKEVGASQYSEIRNIVLKKSRAFIEVYFNRFISGELVENGVRYYIVDYHYEDGRFYIDLIKPVKAEEFQKLLGESDEGI